MSVPKTDDPAKLVAYIIREALSKTFDEPMSEKLEDKIAGIVRQRYAAREQAVRDFVECIKEDGSDMAFARDTEKAYERLLKLYGL